MKSFREFINTTLNEQSAKTDPWNELIRLHRVHFGNKFQQQDLVKSDQQFLVALFDHYVHLDQQKSLNIFATRISGVKIQFGFFNNQLWSCCIETDKTREVTERFKITDIKIQPLIAIFDKAVKAGTFKNLLPVVVK